MRRVDMHGWESALIGPETRLADAIAAIDSSALQIALVVDAGRKLLGTLTDGDVRRALLRRVGLDVPVTAAMCPNPVTAGPDWGHDRMMDVMQARHLLHLPLVDEENRVVGLETLHGLMERELLPNHVFLMAGGFGTRLRPLTQHCPKPLLKVGKKPILELILENCIRAGFHRFFISTHYLPEMIHAHFGDGSRWGVSIRYVHEDTPLGTGGALGLLPHQEIDTPLLLLNGDLLTSLNLRGLLGFHQEHGNIATMCVREFEFQVPYGVITSDGHLVRSMVEKPMQKFFVNAGMYVLSPELVRSVKRLTAEQALRHKYFEDLHTPADEPKSDPISYFDFEFE